jgi:hypothetical protein
VTRLADPTRTLAGFPIVTSDDLADSGHRRQRRPAAAAHRT